MDTKVIIFFIAFLVLAAAVTAHKNPNPSGGSFFHPAQSQNSSSNGNTGDNTQDIQNNIDQAQQQADEIQKELDQEKARKEASTLSTDVSFYSGNAWSSNPNDEYLYFTLNSRHKGNVLISGFTLQSTVTGKTATIGQGVPLIFSGQLNTAQPIYISPGDQVTVSTGVSPLGYSFQVNKCSGYLTQHQTFNPYISLRCPLAEDEPLPSAPNNLSDACLDYLDRLGSCEMPDPSTLLHSNLSEAQCYGFVVNHLNYNSCVSEHKNDRDFYTHEWRIYLGYASELWKSRRETIKLLDLSGKTVGTVAY